MKFLMDLLANLGIASASMSSNACLVWVTDEPKMPKHLIEK